MNTGDIPDSATAPGLEEARERLKLDKMTKTELEAYYRHLDNVVILRDNIFTERAEGRAEGRMEGRAEGELQKAKEIASNLKKAGLNIEIIAQSTGLSILEVEKL